jgi:anti-sigma factor RsiW
MSEITREHLHAYLDDALSEVEVARIEQELRESAQVRALLRQVMGERDRGDHSIGAIWRQERLTCPEREKLGSYLLGVLDEDEESYIRFHLETVACPYCQANLADLREQSSPRSPRSGVTRRILDSSGPLLPPRSSSQ